MYLYGKCTDYKLLDIIGINAASLSDIVEFAERHRLSGNIWQKYIAYLIMMDENPFSISLERRSGTGSCEELAKKDLKELYEIFFNKNLSSPENILYTYIPLDRTLSNEELRKGKIIADFSDRLNSSNNFNDFFKAVKDFYKKYGVGVFGINKAFYMKDNGDLIPVSHTKENTFDDIKGYESQKQRLIINTEAFINGELGNNVLLYGDSGTGKSTSIKATLNRFFHSGLRMIQIQKHQFVHLGNLTEKLKLRNYRFVLYMDDLSFEDFEVEYKYLKAAIEGGLQEKPDNVLIYATSNRRHIIKETFAEREGGDDIHRNESIQEKISLSDRFGLMIYYPKPTQTEYFDMALHIAKREGIELSDEQIISEARKWGVSHGGFSGRAAEQLIIHLKTLK